MKVILTHEQADFDALGALLGAWLLDESSSAILPARLNRNVRRFLNLYTSELPFVEFRDLPGESIQKMTLVDTQSMAAGDFLVGAFAQAAQGWDREDASVVISTENKDNFTKNMVTILCEERIGLTIFRPEALITGDFDGLPATA